MPEYGMLDRVSPWTQDPPDVSFSKALSESADIGLASDTYKIVMKRIKEFEDSLDYDHEVAIMLASFGQSITMTVTEIRYSNPSTLVFHGLVDGKPATLIQHMNQLNFLLRSVEKSSPEKPPFRMGFALPTED